MEQGLREFGLYIHIPFCIKKCDYCDFISFSKEANIDNMHNMDNMGNLGNTGNRANITNVVDMANMVDRYMACLKEEIKSVGEEIQGNVQSNKGNNVDSNRVPIIIKTIYIGGGTPSCVDSKFIVEILELVNQYFCVEKNAEVTIEVNPGAVTSEQLIEYKEVGVNRLSIGLQTTSDTLLKSIGRIHTYSDFKEVFQLAREVGFCNINVDLMIGLPNENLDQVKKDLDQIIQLNPEHISVYSLIVEEGTKLEQRLHNREFNLPNEEVERLMYWEVKNSLEKAGYVHYEISNFAKPNFMSKHNLDCWCQKEYLGLGLAAHSYTDGFRYSNIQDLNLYIQNIELGKPEDNIILHEKQDKTGMAKEFILLSTRTMQGCSLVRFKERFGYELEKGFTKEIQKLTDQGLISIENGFLKLTDQGIDFANLVWEEFV